MDLLVLHTADLHLGRNRKHPDYLLQQQYMLEGIVKQVHAACIGYPNTPIHLYVVGDLFDRNQDTTRSELVLFIMHFAHPLYLLKKQCANLQVFIEDGNHDRTPNPNEPSVVLPLKTIYGEVFHIAVINPVFVGEHSVLMLPYQGFSAADMRRHIQDSRAQHVLAHECLNRMQTDTGWTPPRNQDKYIEIEDVIPDTQAVGIYLGDIHKCQQMDSAGVSWYSGTPVTLDHGHKLPKGILHHSFVKKDGVLQRAAMPTLVPIDDPRIKVHHQLGKISNIEDIPWEKCKEFKNCYLDMVITPEVFEEMNRRVEGMFDSKQVTYSSAEIVASTTVMAGEEEIDNTEETSTEQEQVAQHYDRMIKGWVDDNLTDYTAPLRERFMETVVKDFGAR